MYNNQWMRSFQERKGRDEVPNRWSTRFQVWDAKVQWINRWSLVSSYREQKVQAGFRGMPHIANLTFIGSLFRVATQKLKACFGTPFLNQTALNHSVMPFSGRIYSQVKLVENLGFRWSIGPQRNESCLESSCGSGMLRRVVRSKLTWLFLERPGHPARAGRLSQWNESKDHEGTSSHTKNSYFSHFRYQQTKKISLKV